jgi:hypothetical protein
MATDKHLVLDLSYPTDMKIPIRGKGKNPGLFGWLHAA